MEKSYHYFTFDFTRFTNLQEAFIDASSIIYAQKAEFFDDLQHALTLYTLPEIVREVGFARFHGKIIQCDQTGLTNDQKLLYCAIERQLPVISEDKTILMRTKRAKLPYYNALMMLNWLLFKHTITQHCYSEAYLRLRAIARYSQPVWEYGDSVHTLILQKRMSVETPFEIPLRAG